MSRLYVYAVIGGAPRGSLGRGLAGEALRVLAVGGLRVVVATAAVPPGVDEDALRRQDAIVRRLAVHVDAVLPVRFGARVDDEAALARALRPQAGALAAALELVAGREQMTLRVLRGSAGATAAATAASEAGPGTAYLLGRAQALAAEVPEIEPVRRLLAALVCAERAVRAGPGAPAPIPAVLASVYHLIPRGRAAAYRRAVAAGGALPGTAGLLVSGPFAPYAFAPELSC